MKARANRLYELRREKGISQAALADFLGVSQPRISEYENVRIPYDILMKLTVFFDVSTDYILGISDDRKPKPFINLSREELELVSLARRLSPEQMKILNGVIVGIKDSVKE